MIAHNIFPVTVAVDTYHDAQNFKRIFHENRRNHAIEIDGVLHSTETTGHVKFHLDPNFKPLFDFIGDALIKHFEYNLRIDTSKIDTYITKAWASVVRNNWHVPMHAHGEAHYSFCYYVQVPENSDSLHFYSKCLNEPFYNAFHHEQQLVKEYNFNNSTSWYFENKEGELYIFPASLNHNTKNIRSEISNPAERIAIAGDVMLVLKDNNKLSYGLQPVSNWSKINVIRS